MVAMSSQPSMSSNPGNSHSRRLRLLAVGGRPLEARMINHGDTFGPGQRHVYQGYKPCVEISRVRSLPGSAYLNSLSGELLADLLAPYPMLPVTSDGSVRIPPAEVHRLVEWVDDHEAIRISLPVSTIVAAAGERGQTIAGHLPEKQFEVAVAPDGDTALRIAHERSAQLVIAEEDLPGQNGFQLAREMRRRDSLASAVYVLLGADQDNEHAFAAGANACLPWPLEAADLRSTVGDLLGLA
jgi:CheY-like chemotaxis protein